MVTIENRPDSTSNGRRPKRVGFAPEVGVNGHVGGSEVSPSQANPPVTNERPHPWDNETSEYSCSLNFFHFNDAVEGSSHACHNLAFCRSHAFVFLGRR